MLNDGGCHSLIGSSSLELYDDYYYGIEVDFSSFFNFFFFLPEFFFFNDYCCVSHLSVMCFCLSRHKCSNCQTLLDVTALWAIPIHNDLTMTIFHSHIGIKYVLIKSRLCMIRAGNIQILQKHFNVGFYSVDSVSFGFKHPSFRSTGSYLDLVWRSHVYWKHKLQILLLEFLCYRLTIMGILLLMYL